MVCGGLTTQRLRGHKGAEEAPDQLIYTEIEFFNLGFTLHFSKNQGADSSSFV